LIRVGRDSPSVLDEVKGTRRKFGGGSRVKGQKSTMTRGRAAKVP
jgi:hypothetical protein